MYVRSPSVDSLAQRERILPFDVAMIVVEILNSRTKMINAISDLADHTEPYFRTNGG